MVCFSPLPDTPACPLKLCAPFLTEALDGVLSGVIIRSLIRGKLYYQAQSKEWLSAHFLVLIA